MCGGVAVAVAVVVSKSHDHKTATTAKMTVFRARKFVAAHFGNLFHPTSGMCTTQPHKKIRLPSIQNSEHENRKSWVTKDASNIRAT